MIKFVLASHGELAEGIYSSVRLILGESADLHTVCAYTQGPDDILKKIEKKEDQVVLGRWEIPSEIREAIVAPQICKECYNRLSQKYDMEKAFVPDDEKHVVNFIFFVEIFYLKDNNSCKRSIEYD